MKMIIRAIKRWRRRHPISFRFVREGKEHVHRNPRKKPRTLEIIGKGAAEILDTLKPR